MVLGLNGAGIKLSLNLFIFLSLISLGAGKSVAEANNTPILDRFPDALVAYSLRLLNSGYQGPAILVNRSIDGAEYNISYCTNGSLNLTALLDFVGSGNGTITRWYSQIEGHPALSPPGTDAPFIVVDGKVILDSAGLPRLWFNGSAALRVEDPGLPIYINDSNISFHLVLESLGDGSSTGVVIQMSHYDWQCHSTTIYDYNSDHYWFCNPGDGFGDPMRDRITRGRTTGTFAISSRSAEQYQGHELTGSADVVSQSHSDNYFIIGSRARTYGLFWRGYLSEVLIYPYIGNITKIREHTDNINAYWQTGPKTYNIGALLPQKNRYQVTLYDWLESVTLDDVALPDGTLHWDGNYSDVESLADIWLFFTPHKATDLSRVTRGLPKWYVLNDGNGSGIEATGHVLVFSTNEAGQHSWGNEPAHWYEISLPLANGSNGNPYYHARPLCMRSLVVTAVDLLMYDKMMDLGGGWIWNDMHGKGMLSWTRAVYVCRKEINQSVLAAFESGFRHNMEISIETGARDANTNMDMFHVEAVSLIARYSRNESLRSLALQTAKKLLLGYTDGVLGTHHDVDIGGYYPAGYIGENDMADYFYNGESFYHLVGAWSNTYNLSEWQWLGKIVGNMSEWKYYQAFYDPLYSSEGGSIIDSPRFNGAAGYSGRTGAGFPSGQATVTWSEIGAAALSKAGLPFLRNWAYGYLYLKSEDEMIAAINQEISKLTEFGIPYTDPSRNWSGWSPWPKVYPYLPPKGWYTRLKNLSDSNHTDTIVPIYRRGNYYSKALGGDPTGKEFWSFKSTDGSRDFGWFIEADAKQGNYGGWYGGKIETFWTNYTGIVIMNRHGKTGCNAGDSEDSTCWSMIDIQGAHHVWGRDENGGAFTTLHIKGKTLSRESIFTPSDVPYMVQITNYFNDPGAVGVRGEETGNEIEGNLSVTNTFEALGNGIKVTHSIVADGDDEITELWATLPVYLGDSIFSKALPNTTIEFWDGANWSLLGTSLSLTDKLRIGRDFLTGDGPQYVYVLLEQEREVKLSPSAYIDPYQTNSMIRSVHIDLHGSTGISAILTNRTITYWILTGTVPIPRCKLADSDCNDHIDRSELKAFIRKWRSDQATIDELCQVMATWKKNH